MIVNVPAPTRMARPYRAGISGGDQVVGVAHGYAGRAFGRERTASTWDVPQHPAKTRPFSRFLACEAG